MPHTIPAKLTTRLQLMLTCPNCDAPFPNRLQASSAFLVNYYRCGDCTHVWTTDRETNEILSHVTPLTRQS